MWEAVLMCGFSYELVGDYLTVEQLTFLTNETSLKIVGKGWREELADHMNFGTC